MQSPHSYKWMGEPQQQNTATTTTTTFVPTYLFVCPGSSLAPLLAAEVADSFQVKPVPPVPRMEVAILKGQVGSTLGGSG